jgi:RND superfamily putative drug exporter
VIVLAGAAVVGIGAFDKLRTGGFDDPNSDSTRAGQIIEDRFGGNPNLVLLVTANSGTVDDPQVAALGRRTTDDLKKQHGVANVASYWVGGGELLRSTNGTARLEYVTRSRSCSRAG